MKGCIEGLADFRSALIRITLRRLVDSLVLYRGMDAPDAKRPRESENAKLKKLLAEAHLDMHAS